MKDFASIIKTKRFHVIRVSIVLCLLTIIATLVFWNNTNKNFQTDSEGLVVTMVTAGKHSFDIGDMRFGLGVMSSIEGDVYDVYSNSELYGNSILERKVQIGLQGWAFYYMAKSGVPSPLTAFRLGCCLALALVLSLICFELKKKYGTFFSFIFFIVSITSQWIIDFAPNLYWVTFTWFIPMLLGLFCLNNLNKRKWLYPLIFLAILIKCTCGYEYITVIMLSSIMFLVAEWLNTKDRDKQQSRLAMKTSCMIGIMSLLGFGTSMIINAYMRGNGNILNGINLIYTQDVLRRTFGNAIDFSEAYTDSLNASIVDVLTLYFSGDYAGKLALFLLVAVVFALIFKYKIMHRPLNIDFWLFFVSFITCISWFILGKSHSYIHTHMNYVLWFMGFIQIGIFLACKTILQIFFSDRSKKIFKSISQKLEILINTDT